MSGCHRGRPPSSIACLSHHSTSSHGNRAALPKQPPVRGRRPGFLAAQLPENSCEGCHPRRRSGTTTPCRSPPAAAATYQDRSVDARTSIASPRSPDADRTGLDAPRASSQHPAPLPPSTAPLPRPAAGRQAPGRSRDGRGPSAQIGPRSSPGSHGHAAAPWAAADLLQPPPPHLSTASTARRRRQQPLRTAPPEQAELLRTSS